MDDLTDYDYNILILEAKVEYNATIKHLQHAIKTLNDAFDLLPEIAPTTALVHIENAISVIDYAMGNMNIIEED